MHIIDTLLAANPATVNYQPTGSYHRSHLAIHSLDSVDATSLSPTTSPRTTHPPHPPHDSSLLARARGLLALVGAQYPFADDLMALFATYGELHQKLVSKGMLPDTLSNGNSNGNGLNNNSLGTFDGNHCNNNNNNNTTVVTSTTIRNVTEIDTTTISASLSTRDSFTNLAKVQSQSQQQQQVTVKNIGAATGSAGNFSTRYSPMGEWRGVRTCDGGVTVVW